MPKDQKMAETGPAGAGRIPIRAQPISTPRHSAAKAQRIKAINERNEEICHEIIELGEIQKLIETVCQKLDSEKKVIRKAEIVAKEGIVMPSKEHNILIEGMRASARASCSKVSKVSWDEAPLLDKEDYDWMTQDPGLNLRYEREDP